MTVAAIVAAGLALAALAGVAGYTAWWALHTGRGWRW